MAESVFPLLPTRPTDEQHREYVRNIITAFEAATDDQKARGLAWYQTAHELALMIADGDAVKGAGVIAACSASTGWNRNVTVATRCCGGDISGHTGAVLAKVRRIMDGEDVWSVLPYGKKTWWFAQCIANPADELAVVIDRHAHDIAAGRKYGDNDRGLDNANRYDSLAHAYRSAAWLVGSIPQVVQATTWVWWVDTYGGQRV